MFLVNTSMKVGIEFNGLTCLMTIFDAVPLNTILPVKRAFRSVSGTSINTYRHKDLNGSARNVYCPDLILIKALFNLINRVLPKFALPFLNSISR